MGIGGRGGAERQKQHGEDGRFGEEGGRRSRAVKQTMSRQKGERSSQVTGHSEERERSREREEEEGSKKGAGTGGVREAPWLQNHSLQ